MNRKTIAEHARDFLLENGLIAASWGDYTALDAIADRAGIKDNHPLLRWKLVLAGLERAPHLFRKYYIETNVFHDYRSRRVRSFRLLEAPDPP